MSKVFDLTSSASSYMTFVPRDKTVVQLKGSGLDKLKKWRKLRVRCSVWLLQPVGNHRPQRQVLATWRTLMKTWKKVHQDFKWLVWILKLIVVIVATIQYQAVVMQAKVVSTACPIRQELRFPSAQTPLHSRMKRRPGIICWTLSKLYHVWIIIAIFFLQLVKAWNHDQHLPNFTKKWWVARVELSSATVFVVTVLRC